MPPRTQPRSLPNTIDYISQRPVNPGVVEDVDAPGCPPLEATLRIIGERTEAYKDVKYGQDKTKCFPTHSYWKDVIACLSTSREESTSLGTPQLRGNWRRNFEVTDLNGETVVWTKPDKKYIITKEMIHRVLVWAHLFTKHGGRDKTYDLVRKFYATDKVTKAFITDWVSQCPSCQGTRGRNEEGKRKTAEELAEEGRPARKRARREPAPLQMAQPTGAAADDHDVVPDFGLDHDQGLELNYPVMEPIADNPIPLSDGLQPTDEAQDVDVTSYPSDFTWTPPEDALFDHLPALSAPESTAYLDQQDAAEFVPLTDYNFDCPELDAFLGLPGRQFTGEEALTPALTTAPTTPAIFDPQHVNPPQFWQPQVQQKFRPNAAIDDWILKFGTGVPEKKDRSFP